MINKIYYKILTPYGDYYQLDKNGYVLKYSNGIDKTNATITQLKTWQVIGLVKLKPFGNIGNTIPLEKAINIENFCFKNGNPKYTIIDLDHGTTRLVGNTKAHGVKCLYRV